MKPYTIEPHFPLVFHRINHDMVDHTWSDVESLATQERGAVTIVVRKYKRKEWSARILGLGCEGFRVVWEGRSGGLPDLETAIHAEMVRRYPSHAMGPVHNC